MRPRATIYKSGKSPHGQVFIALPKGVRIAYHFARGIGLGLITAAIAAVFIAYSPIVKEETYYQLHNAGIVKEPDYAATIAQAAQTEEIQREAESLGVDPYFSLVVPKIDARANIIANVDTASENEYSQALTKGVAHAKGTYFPGQGKPIFLFAHSTNSSFNIARYNAVFYLLSKLEEGDTVVVFFADKKYVYKVTNTVVTDPTDTSWLYDSRPNERLYLMTCTPPGTAWNRLFVVAEPVN
jgi:LPXTG-site transpeptidase (sortase) family protein